LRVISNILVKLAERSDVNRSSLADHGGTAAAAQAGGALAGADRAAARAREAGAGDLNAGVMIAPVLPGITDDVPHLEA